MTYVQPAIVVDEGEIADAAYGVLADRVPGWEPSVGSLDTALLEAAVRLAVELRGLVADVSDLIVQGLATSIFGMPRDDATAALVSATFTLVSASPGFTIPAGTQFALSTPDGDLVAFETVADAVTSTTSATVEAAAVEPGTVGNGLGPGAGAMIDALPNVDGVAAASTSAGGAEGESDDAYLDRIARRMRLVAVHPILPLDFALLAVDVDGVHRAMALDGYDPVGGTFGNVRTVTVVVQDAAGQPVAGSVRTAVDALLQADREVGFVVNVIDPVYATLTVAATVVKSPDAVSAQVGADVQAALAAFLAPQSWGGPVGEGDVTTWASQPTVYRNQLIAVAGGVPGVVRVSALTINGGTADVTLAGGVPHALPNLSAPPTVTVT